MCGLSDSAAELEGEITLVFILEAGACPVAR